MPTERPNASASTPSERLERARPVACQAITELNVLDVHDLPARHQFDPRRQARFAITSRKGRKPRCYRRKLLAKYRKVDTAMERQRCLSRFFVVFWI